MAVAKIDKYGHSTSGDTVEVIERPNGGISVVLADGQKNRVSDKKISTMISHQIIGHISEGTRDGTAIRKTAQHLFSEHQGAITANLNILSADLQTNTLVLTQNSPVPLYLIRSGNVDCLDNQTQSIGLTPEIDPIIIELGIEPGMAVVSFSDGVFQAGRNHQQSLDPCTMIEALIDEQELSAQEIADFILKQAIQLDNNRPNDDMSVVVMLVTSDSQDRIRRMNVSINLG